MQVLGSKAHNTHAPLHFATAQPCLIRSLS